jgi:hypothetical protein
VSHAGTALLRELAVETGLVKGWTAALAETYRSAPMHAPGQVLVDLAVTIADGGDALRHLRALRDQAKLFGPVASDPTAWRVVDRVDTARLDLLRARSAAREGPGAGLGGRRRTGSVAGTAAALRLHPAHRVLGEGERRTHVEEGVRVPVRHEALWRIPG